MSIDLATGLPELPEGLFWVVSWKRPDPREGVRSEPQYGEMPKVLEVRICKPIVIDRKRVTRSFVRSWRTLWLKEMVTDYEPYTIEGMQTIESAGLYWDGIFSSQKAATQFKQGWVHVIDKSIVKDPNLYYAVKPMENTPENVLVVAKQVYKRYNSRMEDLEKQRAQRLMEKELVGTYPPKKLEL